MCEADAPMAHRSASGGHFTLCLSAGCWAGIITAAANGGRSALERVHRILGFENPAELPPRFLKQISRNMGFSGAGFEGVGRRI